MPADRIDDLRHALTSVADVTKAPSMAAYMKDRFVFLGVPAPERKTAQRPFVSAGGQLVSAELLDLAGECWAQPEREFQYSGIDLLARWVATLKSDDLPRVETLIRTSSWWDTVDALASNVVGPMVAADPGLAEVMDRWIDDDLWVARTAILHQLKWRERTDAERLFGYVDRRSADTDFFIRKASGWALREYSKTDPDAVRIFVADRGERLSGLTRREALKRIRP